MTETAYLALDFLIEERGVGKRLNRCKLSTGEYQSAEGEGTAGDRLSCYSSTRATESINCDLIGFWMIAFCIMSLTKSGWKKISLQRKPPPGLVFLSGTDEIVSRNRGGTGERILMNYSGRSDGCEPGLSVVRTITEKTAVVWSSKKWGAAAASLRRRRYRLLTLGRAH